MANPTRTVAIYRAKVGRDQRAIQATADRMAADPMVIDMGKFQRGEMTAEEFKQKYERA